MFDMFSSLFFAEKNETFLRTILGNECTRRNVCAFYFIYGLCIWSRFGDIGDRKWETVKNSGFLNIVLKKSQEGLFL